MKGLDSVPTLFYYYDIPLNCQILMSQLYQVFSSVLEPYSPSINRIVIAFSGGVDSRVLLELAARYGKAQGIECIAVHIHHGLSTNADVWVKKCQQWCLESAVKLYVERVSLDTSSSESLEKLARDARYGALKAHLSKGDILLTGQHQDDQLETFLLALKRGSGPKGLSSMAKVMSFGEAVLVRPLLGVSRQEIEMFASQSGLEWVEDESNQDQRFDRNFIRHEVTPKLVARWPSFPDSVARSAQLCAEQELLLDELLVPKLNQALGLHQSLKIESLLDCSNVMRARLLRMWLAENGLVMPSQKQLELLWSEVACAQQDANPVLVLGDTEVRRFDNKLFIVESRPSLESWQAELKVGQSLELPDNLGSLSLNINGSAVSQEAQSMVKFSLSNASGPITVMFNPEGLTAHPVGRGHSRKMKKLFQEYKVPSWLRRRTPILIDGDHVVAVMGLFVDRRYQGQDCEAVWSK